MSQWLKSRLVALFCVVTLCSGASYLHAQNGYPAPPRSPAAAGEGFLQVLTLSGSSSSLIDESEIQQRLHQVVSRRNFEDLATGIPRLMRILLFEQNQPQFSGRTVSNDGKSAVVEVSPSVIPRPLPLVVVAEDGGWRVDVIATYAKLNGLEGQALDDRLFRVTGTFPKGAPASDNARRSQCQSNLKQIMLGVLQYAQDYDDRLPPARKWTDVIRPYVKNRAIFTCPAVPAGKRNGYAFNQNLSQISFSKIAELSQTVSVYETSNLGENVFGPGTGRAYRHKNGSNLAFVDGHVKFFARGGETKVSFKP